MGILNQIGVATRTPSHDVPANWRFIIPVCDKKSFTRDGCFVNYIVAALQDLVGAVDPNTQVKAPGKRFHPILKKWMDHKGWDVTFHDTKSFTLDAFDAHVKQYFSNYKREAAAYDEKGGGGWFIKFTGVPSTGCKSASRWTITLCHFKVTANNPNQGLWTQGKTGLATGDHVHIGIQINGQIA